MKRLVWGLCLVVWGLPAWAAADAKATQAQLDKLKKEITTLQSSIQQRGRQQQTEEAALAEAERAIGRVTEQIRSLDQELLGLDENLSGLQGRRDELEQALAQRQALIAELLHEQYRQGRQPRLQLLLKQEDPEQLDRMLRYYDEFSQGLSQQLRLYQAQLLELNSTRTQIGSTEGSIREKRTALATEQQRLSEARARRQSAIQTLRQSQQQDQQRLSRLQQDQKQLEGVMAQIQRSLEAARLARDNQSFAGLRGKLPWPVKGAVLHRFGQQRSGVAFDGMLIGANAGTQVQAVHAGRVVFSDWLRGYGLVLILDHGSGYMSLYGHNQSLSGQPGDWVTAGQTIARVGNSGGHEETGLYFAVRHNGKPVNPAQWLSNP